MKMAAYIRTLFLVVAIALMSCSKDNTNEQLGLETFNVVELESQLMQLTNDYRQSQGMSTVVFDAVAYTYANEHTDYMISKGSLSHDNFNSRASSISSETQAQEVAENVAKDYITAETALEGWINSAPHRANLEGDFTHMAISVKKTESGSLYYMQIFFK